MNILIVKLSSLGDVVHAMPAVQDIRRQRPDAQIDWVVERGFAPLAARCAGVRRTIPVELRRWRKAPFRTETRRAWAEFKADLQREAYDAVIDLQGLSKSALVAWLARLAPGGKRYGLANRTEGSSYEAPARWVADVAVTLPEHSHAVTRSRLLCAAALGYDVPQGLSFGLQSSARSEPEAWIATASRPRDDDVGHGKARSDAAIHGLDRNGSPRLAGLAKTIPRHGEEPKATRQSRSLGHPDRHASLAMTGKGEECSDAAILVPQRTGSPRPAGLAMTVQDEDRHCEERGDAAIQPPLAQQVTRPEVALVHGTSRADKQWPLAHWRELGARLNAAGYGVVLPHGSAAEEATSREIAAGLAHARVWPRLALDQLTDALAGCAGVIGVDSGLSHIAVALDLPHVQLYNFDTAWRTGPLPGMRRQCSVFAQPAPSVDAVWQAWCAVSR